MTESVCTALKNADKKLHDNKCDSNKMIMIILRQTKLVFLKLYFTANDASI